MGSRLPYTSHDMKKTHSMTKTEDARQRRLRGTSLLTALFALLQEEDLAWAVRKDNRSLLNSANKFLTDPNNQDMIKKMTKYWIPFAQ